MRIVVALHFVDVRPEPRRRVRLHQHVRFFERAEVRELGQRRTHARSVAERVHESVESVS